MAASGLRISASIRTATTFISPLTTGCAWYMRIIPRDRGASRSILGLTPSIRHTWGRTAGAFSIWLEADGGVERRRTVGEDCPARRVRTLAHARDLAHGVHLPGSSETSSAQWLLLLERGRGWHRRTGHKPLRDQRAQPPCRWAAGILALQSGGAYALARRPLAERGPRASGRYSRRQVVHDGSLV